MKPEIITSLTCKWGVQRKIAGYQAEDYFSSEDYQTAQDAYELAKSDICNRNIEWVALFAKGRMTHEGFIPPHIRLLDDRRPNNDPISSVLAGFINSLSSSDL